MTKKVLRVLSILSVLLGLMTAASAQSNALRVAIPFDFRVGETLLSSGTYTIRIAANGQVVQMFNNDTKQAAISMTNPGDVPGSPTRTSLIFSRYGDVIFLSEIQWEGNKTSRQLLKSHTELEIAKTIRGVRILAGAR